MRLFAKRGGAYTGRLAFDPDSEFHVSVDGRRVVTTDAGKTWRYATNDDTSHNARYQTRVHVVDATTEDAPHHVEPQPGDRHFDGIQFQPDHKAPTLTGHTDAWND